MQSVHERTARQLFLDLDHYRRCTSNLRKLQQEKGVPFRPYKWTAERLQFFVELSVWCTARGIDPRRWLWFLFNERAWIQPLGLLPIKDAWSQFMRPDLVRKYRESLAETKKPNYLKEAHVGTV